MFKITNAEDLTKIKEGLFTITGIPHTPVYSIGYVNFNGKKIQLKLTHPIFMQVTNPDGIKTKTFAIEKPSIHLEKLIGLTLHFEV